MSLKYEVENIDELDESVRDFYEEKDGKYVLKVEGAPEPKQDNGGGNLKKELERFKAKHAEAEKHRKEQERLAREAAEKAAKNSGDVEALEKSWQEKLDSTVSEKQKELEHYQNLVSKMTVGNTTLSLASELFGEDADLFSHHIEKRLSYDIVDGEPKVRVLDEAGNPSAKTLDDLKKEMTQNPKISKYIVGSKASGTGAAGKTPNGSIKKFGDMTEKELVQLRKNDPQEYDRLKSEAGY